MRPLRELQVTRVATREESGVLGFPSRRGLTPRGSEEVYEHRVLINSGPGNGVFPHVAPPTRLHLQFPRETGLILRRAGKVGNPFQT